MPRVFPTRTEAHQLEEHSERFFREHLPRGWTCEKPLHDYGVDLRVEIFEAGKATGLELLVQLKASQRAARGTSEGMRLRVATFNHLKAKVQIAMVVKFIADENEAYWQLVRDIAPPSQRHRTFSIAIPKNHRLSTIDWDQMRQHIAEVTHVKLGAGRKTLAGRRLRED